jgi:hypothetical protein
MSSSVQYHNRKVDQIGVCWRMAHILLMESSYFAVEPWWWTVYSISSGIEREELILIDNVANIVVRSSLKHNSYNLIFSIAVSA